MAFSFSIMKVLKYSEETLNQIAIETDTNISEIQEIYERSIKLNLVVYSVINMIAWGTKKPLPNATFITEDILLKHYRFLPKTPGSLYQEVKPL